MESTVAERDDALNATHVLAMLQTAGSAFAQATQHQAEAARHASTSNVEVARIEADKQVKLAQISTTSGQHVLWSLMGFVGAIVLGSFYTGHVEVATHTISAVGGGVAGWLAGRARR